MKEGKNAMTGSIRKRYENSWSLIIDLGYQLNPATGLRKRKQKWITFRGTKKQAQAKLNDVIHALNRNEFVEPTKLTLGEWLDSWLERAVKPPSRRQGTYDTYKHVIETHLKKSFLAGMRLQHLKASDFSRYYSELTVAPATKAQHHAILHSALKAATLDGL